MLYHLASHLSTLGECENEERKCEEGENEERKGKPVTPPQNHHNPPLSVNYVSSLTNLGGLTIANI